MVIVAPTEPGEAWFVDDDPTMEIPVVVTSADLAPPSYTAPSPPAYVVLPSPPFTETLAAVADTATDLGRNLVAVVVAALGGISWLLKVLRPLVPIVVVLVLIALPVALVPWGSISDRLFHHQVGGLPVVETTTTTTTTTTVAPRRSSPPTTEAWNYGSTGQRVEIVRPGLSSD